MSSILTVSNGSDFLPATKRAKAGDTVKLTSDIQLPGNSWMEYCDGINVDGDGKKITFPGPVEIDQFGHGLGISANNITISNLKIDNAKMALMTSGGFSNLTLKNIGITKARQALKVGGADNGPATKNIVIDGMNVSCDDNPVTIFDFGPALVDGIVMRNVESHAKSSNNDTGADGIGIERGTSVLLENVWIDGCGGDAFDVKGQAIMRYCVASNANRQSFKIWGRPDAQSIMEHCLAFSNGYGGFLQAGTNCKKRDSYLEAGRYGDCSMNFGPEFAECPNGVNQWGAPEDYACRHLDLIIERTLFISHNTGAGSALISGYNQGRLTLQFNGCTFFVPNHPCILQLWPMGYLYAGDAANGKWAVQPYDNQPTAPANTFSDCKYGDVPLPSVKDWLSGYVPSSGGGTGGGGETGGSTGTIDERVAALETFRKVVETDLALYDAWIKKVHTVLSSVSSDFNKYNG